MLILKINKEEKHTIEEFRCISDVWCIMNFSKSEMEKEIYKKLTDKLNNTEHILTGDANLKEEPFQDIFFKFIKTDFQNALVFQIPHHGSKNNWSNNLYTELKNIKCWIFSRGNKNIHGHPSADMSIIPELQLFDLTEYKDIEFTGYKNK